MADRQWISNHLRLLFIVEGFLLFALGGGIARYLGVDISGQAYILGQGWVTLSQISGMLIFDYTNPEYEQKLASQANRKIGGWSLTPKNALLLALVTSLAGLASFSVIFITTGSLNPQVLVLLIVAIGAMFFYSQPPLRLAENGYGELTLASLVTIIVPALAFTLQSGSIHRLIAMASFPIFTLHMATVLSVQFSTYINDGKSKHKSLLVKIGWENGMFTHNLLIASTYLLMAVAVMLGMSMAIGLPVFLTLPFAAIQIWHMRKISEGARPNWASLTFGAVILFTIIAYMITYAFWTR